MITRGRIIARDEGPREICVREPTTSMQEIVLMPILAWAALTDAFQQAKRL